MKSAWSPNQATNFETLQNELGFTGGGHFFRIEGTSHAIVVSGDNCSNEVTIKLYMWNSIEVDVIMKKDQPSHQED
ncbi:hypothetical protein AMS60_21760 [Bacillus sp. FJAT-21945]|nr:hypothetical protein AMS60_21760 [Bacillus sp. FJAT-21945]